MNILGTLFGSDEVVKKTTDGLYNGLDKIKFTEEEKSDHFGWLLKLYEPFKVAQRFLALTFGIPYALAWFITFIASFFTSITAQLALLTGTMGYIVLTIVGFYFGGGALEGVVKSALSAQKGNKNAT